MRRVIAAAIVVSGALAGGVRAPEVEARPKGLYLAAHDSASPNLLHTFSVGADGTLTPLEGSPVNTGNSNSGCGGYCQSLTYSSRRKLLFSSGGSGISVTDFSGATPVLVPGSPFAGTKLDGVTVVEKGRNTYVYGASYQTDQILGFKVLPNDTLEALPGSPFAAGPGPDGLSSAGDLVFVAHEGVPSIGSYKVSANGTLMPAPTFPTAISDDSFVYNVNADPSGKFVYMGDCNNGRVFGFKVNKKNAELTALPGSPFATETGAVCAGVLPASKKLLFALNDGSAGANIQALRKSAKGTLESLGEAQSSVSNAPRVGAIDPKGRFLATVHESDALIRLFTINKKSGAVTPATTYPQSFLRVNGAVFVEK